MTTSITESFLEPNIILYPNPSSSFFTVEAPNLDDNTMISIKNILGEELFFTKLYQHQQDIDVSYFKTGLYFVTVYHYDKSITKKLLLER